MPIRVPQAAEILQVSPRTVSNSSFPENSTNLEAGIRDVNFLKMSKMW